MAIKSPRACYGTTFKQSLCLIRRATFSSITPCSTNATAEKEPARRQLSGNAKQVIEGIGLVTCIYVNPELDHFRIIDYRLYVSETNGKTKINHFQDMLQHTVEHKRLAFSTVLMDAWYATMAILKLIEGFGLLPDQGQPPGESQPRSCL